MAITTIDARDIDPTGSVALSASYLGSGNYIEAINANTAEVTGTDAAVAVTIKWSYDGGATFNNERVMAANEVFEIEDIGGRVLTLDAKAASGSLNISARR